jgi:hypothetical protein
VEDTRELDRVVYGNFPELRVGYRAGIGAQAEDGSVLIRKRLRERGAVREVPMQNFRPAWDGRCQASCGRSPSRAQRSKGPAHRKGVAADHSRGADDDKTHVARRR